MGGRVFSLALVALVVGGLILLLRRVEAPYHPPPPASGTSPPALAHPSDSPRAGQQEFARIRDPSTGQLLRFNPCAPVHYVINPTLAPPDGVRLAQEAVASLSTATKISFLYDGTSSETARINSTQPVGSSPIFTVHRDAAALPDGRWQPVLISWQTSSTAVDKENGGLAGLIAAKDRATGVSELVTGVIVMNPAKSGSATKPTLLHELGHVVGLDHVAQSEQIMNPSQLPVSAAWGAGDLAGLRQVGRDAGCMPTLTLKGSILFGT